MKNRKLLFSITKKDLDIQTFRCGGNGGQNVNKIESGVRIVHRESGGVGESREERSQHANKQIAFKRLQEHPRFKLWFAKKVQEELTGKTVEDIVEESMKPENLKIEGKNEEGKWEELNGEV